MAPIKSLVAFSVLLASQLVSGHAVITGATGNAGGQGSALGVNSATPRDGTGRRPFQQDATRFRGATAGTVGETVGAGPNNLEAGTAKILSEMGGTLPQVTPGGQVMMTLHQVNADGAGPYTCMINADGTANSWQNIQVQQNVDGSRGRNRQGQASDHPLTASIPAGQQCTGEVAGQSNVCLVRCQNPARAGPFGGVIPVQMVDNNANAGNANAGNANAGNANAGNANAGNANAGNANAGNANAGNAKAGNAKAGNANAGNAKAGNQASGNNNGATRGNAAQGNRANRAQRKETEADLEALEEQRRSVEFEA